jgi:LysM repeat protein
MSFLGRFSLSALAAAMIVAVNGCLPSEPGALDEEKEPHFVLGKSRINAMDYTGAVEAFQESLEANPRSAAAHFQLAMLFDTKESDPAAAIYHYQQYLKLDPAARNPEVIRQRIDSCKQQLAADVLQLPSAPAAQQQLEKLVEQNRLLQQKADQLQAVVKQWSDYYASQPAARVSPAPNNPVAPPGTSFAPDDLTTATATQPATPLRTTPAKPAPPKNSQPRTHVVAANETLAAIARKQGFSVAAMTAANPGVNPKKLHVGQVLNLPPP